MDLNIGYRYGRNTFRTFTEGLEKEWLLTNGIGGFANSTIIGASNRIFSGYLIASLHPPVERMLVLAKTMESVVINGIEHDLAAQEYPGEFKEGFRYLNQFTLDILPNYVYQVNDIVISKTIAMKHGENAVSVCYEITGGKQESVLHITPLFTYRPFGDTAQISDLNFKMELCRNVYKDSGTKLILTPPAENSIHIEFFASSGEFYDRKLKLTSMATPNYLIDENEVFRMDQRTGFTGVDHMATPYDVCVTVAPFEHKKMFVNCSLVSDDLNLCSVKTTNADGYDGFIVAANYRERINKLLDRLPYNDTLAKRLTIAADAFIVNRESTGLRTILAGFPWFADWGRDTMIALQGLTMVTGRLEDAKDVLESFSRYVKDGMIPNVFPNSAKDKPQYNTIDASLWYFYSVDKFLDYAMKMNNENTMNDARVFIKEKIYPVLMEIIESYKTGTSYGIHMDTDGLIMGGSDYDQLTWMDVRVGNIVVTPRHGKPVEVNALWYNALKVMEKLTNEYKSEESDQKTINRMQEQLTEYTALSEKAKESFTEKFWNAEKKCLYDVILGGTKDTRVRPNQIYAVSLPYTMLSREQELAVVQTVYEKLYTPYGLRSLEADDSEYKPDYYGKLLKRDMAYHMGTAWAYLSGAFISAFCKVGDYSEETLIKAEEMCRCFGDHMEDGCINGIAEIFDGDFSCTGRGCYTQAWSVGEILRAYTEEILDRKGKKV